MKNMLPKGVHMTSFDAGFGLKWGLTIFIECGESGLMTLGNLNCTWGVTGYHGGLNPTHLENIAHVGS